ncbi:MULTISPECIES: VOC family virulence protein [Rhodococcus]|uniref:VOC family virulence protein n=1 Tax=Rhodococcus TaxID=1827 RepID=UPI00157C9A64|nr:MULTISPECIES: VOC family virulence protein [Rhodococcus]
MRVAEWRASKIPFPSVRITPETIIDLVAGPRGQPNVDHLCLTVHPVDWDAVIKSGTFTVLEGPVQRFGARGIATSIYIQDPGTSTLELRW